MLAGLSGDAACPVLRCGAMSASPAIAIDPAAASPANGPALEPRSPRVRMRRLADGTRVCEAALRIEGMHCAACSGVIEAALRSSPGVLRADVSAIAERAELRWRPEATDIDRLIAVVHAAGYRAAGDGTPQAALLRRHEQRVLLMRWFVAAFCAMQVMMLATPTGLESRFMKPSASLIAFALAAMGLKSSISLGKSITSRIENPLASSIFFTFGIM